MEAHEPITVYTVNNPFEAKIIRTALQAQGISCELDGEGQAGLADILEIGILVPAKDADLARRIIEESRPKKHGE